jgi:anti-sigma B factor antagonist
MVAVTELNSQPRHCEGFARIRRTIAGYALRHRPDFARDVAGAIMMGVLEVGTNLFGKTAVVRAAGEVDMSTAPELRARILDACAAVREPAPVVVDLTGITFFGSSGISVLMAAYQRCQEQRTPLRVVATTRVVLRTLHIAGLGEVLDIRDSLSDATRIQAA